MNKTYNGFLIGAAMKLTTPEYLQTNPKPGYLFLNLLGFLLITTSLTTLVLGYDVIEIHGFIFSAAALIIPFRYLLGDIIAEIYGLSTAKKMIWYIVISLWLIGTMSE